MLERQVKGRQDRDELDILNRRKESRRVSIEIVGQRWTAYVLHRILLSRHE